VKWKEGFAKIAKILSALMLPALAVLMVFRIIDWSKGRLAEWQLWRWVVELGFFAMIGSTVIYWLIMWRRKRGGT
jgi:phage-related holin